MSKKSDQVNLAALELRLIDMAQGAMGNCDFDHLGENGGLCGTMGTAEWLVWVQAVKKTFMDTGLNSAPAQSVAFELWNLTSPTRPKRRRRTFSIAGHGHEENLSRPDVPRPRTCASGSGPSHHAGGGGQPHHGRGHGGVRWLVQHHRKPPGDDRRSR